MADRLTRSPTGDRVRRYDRLSRPSATSHQWLRLTPSNVRSSASPAPQTARLRRVAPRSRRRSSAACERPMTSVGVEPVGLPAEPGDGRRCEQPRPEPGTRHSAAHDRARPASSSTSAAGPGAEVQRDVTAGTHDPHRLGDERQRVVELAVLERDVAEREIGDVVGHVERAAVGDLRSCAGGRPCRTGRRSRGSARGSGVEIAGDTPCRTRG